MAKMGEREWYFFVARDRRSGQGGKPNRITEKGYWKATGSDRHIRIGCLNEPKKFVGLRKTLVFYTGKAPRGCRTDWVMNEYKLISTSTSTSIPLPAPGDEEEDIVLCKVYRKATTVKVLEQRAADQEHAQSQTTSAAVVSSCVQNSFDTPLISAAAAADAAASRGDNQEFWGAPKTETSAAGLIQIGSMKEQQQLPTDHQLSTDWELLDPTWAQHIFAMW